MAFNLVLFRKRTLTAIVFVLIMLLGLFYNRWSFLTLFLIIHIGCFIEYEKLVLKIDYDYQTTSTLHRYGFILMGCCLVYLFCSHYFEIFGNIFHRVSVLLMFCIAFLILISDLILKKTFPLKNYVYSLFGLIYISLSCGLMLSLYNRIDNSSNHISEIWLSLRPVFYPFLIIASLWINDTMAYIFGSLIGKNPLSKISPKKTWEGTLAGIIFSGLFIFIVIYLISHQFSFACICSGVSILSSISGTIGDLFESKLKRLASVKDSGNILPGHGGFLDRFDSLLFASTIVTISLHLFL